MTHYDIATIILDLLDGKLTRNALGEEIAISASFHPAGVRVTAHGAGETTAILPVVILPSVKESASITVMKKSGSVRLAHKVCSDCQNPRGCVVAGLPCPRQKAPEQQPVPPTLAAGAGAGAQGGGGA